MQDFRGTQFIIVQLVFSEKLGKSLGNRNGFPNVQLELIFEVLKVENANLKLGKQLLGFGNCWLARVRLDQRFLAWLSDREQLAKHRALPALIHLVLLHLRIDLVFQLFQDRNHADLLRNFQPIHQLVKSHNQV